MLFTHQLDEDLIDNALLSKKEIQKYDFDTCLEKVMKKVDDFIYYQSRYPNIPKIKITTSYEIRYEFFLPKVTDKVGNYIEQVVDTEIKIKQLYSDIALALSTLSKQEFDYFLEVLYYKKSENFLIEKIQTTRFLLKHIKTSAIIKLAIALDVFEEAA